MPEKTTSVQNRGFNLILGISSKIGVNEKILVSMEGSGAADFPPFPPLLTSKPNAPCQLKLFGSFLGFSAMRISEPQKVRTFTWKYCAEKWNQET